MGGPADSQKAIRAKIRDMLGIVGTLQSALLVLESGAAKRGSVETENSLRQVRFLMQNIVQSHIVLSNLFADPVDAVGDYDDLLNTGIKAARLTSPQDSAELEKAIRAEIGEMRAEIVRLQGALRNLEKGAPNPQSTKTLNVRKAVHGWVISIVESYIALTRLLAGDAAALAAVRHLEHAGAHGMIQFLHLQTGFQPFYGNVRVGLALAVLRAERKRRSQK